MLPLEDPPIIQFANFDDPFMTTPDLNGQVNHYTPSSHSGGQSISPELRYFQNPISEYRTPADSISHIDASIAPPTSTSTKKISPKSTPSTNSTDSKVTKRTLNTLAARRYRQKRVDQMADLEAELKSTQAERDELKVRVARLEGELEALKGLLKR